MPDRAVGFSKDGSEDQGWKLYITSLVTILVAGLFVIARLVTRLVRRNPGWDDVSIVVSLSFSIVLSIAIQLAVSHGYGMHKADLTQAELEAALKWYFIALTPYKVTVCLNKVSVILLCLRIFVSKSFRTTAFTLLFIIVGYSIGSIAATVFQCTPIQGAWLPDSGATCIDPDKFWVAYAVLNITTDVMVLVLPVWPILNLQLGLRDRLLLCGVFVVAAFVTIAAILRTTSVPNSPENREDPTYYFVNRGVWTLLEANLGIISACLPILKHPLTRLFPRLFGTTNTDTNTNTTANATTAPNTNPDRHPNSSIGDYWPTTAPTHRPSPNPRFWRHSLSKHSPSKHERAVSGGAGPRRSDEHHIVGGSLKGGSNDTIELEDRLGSRLGRRWSSESFRGEGREVG
ncbi:uncharacterized protein B0H64DRAFT_423839 [Chaetomium fimeti]|uniref:Rhodopsin domain-containing protein n=1 Tax=Chaetomium fimeti TaxID=1854472 RepID=A0AAE0HJY7_9PEZI|nr:hypothetical protein B0H64DRAFT_423839 [Chaetomium fimeti]